MRIFEDRNTALFNSWDGIAPVRGMQGSEKIDFLESLLVANRDDWDKMYNALQRCKLQLSKAKETELLDLARGEEE
jgi:hypothetical protein